MQQDSNLSAINLFNRPNSFNKNGSKVVMNLMRPELNMPSLSQMPRATTMLQDLECYSSRAQGILKEIKFDYKSAKLSAKQLQGPGSELPTVLLQKAKNKFDKQAEVKLVKIIDKVKQFLATDDIMKAYKKNGVTYYSRKLLKDFHKFLKANLVAPQVPNLPFIGALSTALRFNEIEI